MPVAPPSGAYIRGDLKILKQLQVREVFTTATDGEAQSEAWIKPRFSISMDTSLEAVEMQLSGQLGRLQRLRSRARQYAQRLL